MYFKKLKILPKTASYTSPLMLHNKLSVSDSKPLSASTWPQVLEDTQARIDWDWNPKYTLENMVPYMLDKVRDQLKKEIILPVDF